MRKDGRENHQIRDVRLTAGYIKNIPGSVLIEQGDTRVICTATFENKVPHFLRDSGKGWVTAEYAMMPGSAGNPRLNRERLKANSRSIEIQRFLGRAMRNTFDLKILDGKTIFIDTDVIQADGSTRCAALNGSVIALAKALRYLVYENMIKDFPDFKTIAAVSVGIKGSEILADLTYDEDANIDADINVVSSEEGHVMEVQAFAEENFIPQKLFHEAIDLAINKNFDIIEQIKKHL